MFATVATCKGRYKEPLARDFCHLPFLNLCTLYCAACGRTPTSCLHPACTGQATPSSVTFPQSLCPDHLVPVGAPWYLRNQPRSEAQLLPHSAAAPAAPPSPLTCRPAHTLKQINWRLSDEPVREDTPAEQRDPEYRASVRTYIFLGYTSNLVSAGVREHIRWVSTWRG